MTAQPGTRSASVSDFPLSQLYSNFALFHSTPFPLQLSGTSEAIDPGVSVYRDPWNPAELVITARPQGMRHTDGRHAGYHSGVGWAGLTKSVNERALPLDNVFTKTNEPYGLPSFSYHGNVVSWFWRYACPQYPCFKVRFTFFKRWILYSKHDVFDTEIMYEK